MRAAKGHELDGEIGDLKAKHTEAFEDLEDVQAQLDLARNLFANWKNKCAEIDAELEVRANDRQTEIAAAYDTNSFPNSDEAEMTATAASPEPRDGLPAKEEDEEGMTENPLDLLCDLLEEQEGLDRWVCQAQLRSLVPTMPDQEFVGLVADGIHIGLFERAACADQAVARGWHAQQHAEKQGLRNEAVGILRLPAAGGPQACISQAAPPLPRRGGRHLTRGR